jgi:hypothetical protein
VLPYSAKANSKTTLAMLPTIPLTITPPLPPSDFEVVLAPAPELVLVPVVAAVPPEVDVVPPEVNAIPPEVNVVTPEVDAVPLEATIARTVLTDDEALGVGAAFANPSMTKA